MFGNFQGELITIEGIDGAGKTTQAKLLVKYLREKGKKVLHTKEPGGSDIAYKIRSILLNPNYRIDKYTELFLYLAARADHTKKVILPGLEKYDIIICERFIDSTLAYQGFGEGIDIELIHKLNSLAACGITPKLTILLDREITKLNHQDKDRIESKSLEFHKKVREGYLLLSKKFPERIKIIKVDNLQIQQTQNIIRNYIEDLCKNKRKY
jgi:dTMP kinase